MKKAKSKTSRLTLHLDQMLLFLLGVIILFYSITQLGGVDNAPNFYTSPALFPILAAVLLIVFSGVQFIIAYRASNALNGEENASSIRIRPLLIGLLVIVLYLLAIPVIGYLIPTLLTLLFFMYVFGKPSIIGALTVAIISTVVLYIVFVIALDVPIPTLLHF